MHKLLPIGIQNFRDFKARNYIYVDKTAHIYRMLTTGQFYFLSRPRRFGKSLLLSTIKEIFLGNKPLFEGLWIEHKWNWETKHPVVHLSFAILDYQNLGLATAINQEMERVATEHGLVLHENDYKSRFRELIDALYAAFGQVVILVDEYDKPIIDYLEGNQLDHARDNQDILKIFYSVLKDASPKLRFVLLTGVSKFTKVSIFSDLNHLNDLTLARDYALLTGYTQQELQDNFKSYLEATATMHQQPVEDLLEKMRLWYNGYSWDGLHKVYNPFGVLNFFAHKEFNNYWFSTGTPTLLIHMMKQQAKFNFEKVSTTADLLDKYSLDNLDMTSLLFQTGYLTITERDISNGMLMLDYPNYEVRNSMYSFLIDGLAPNRDAHYASLTIRDLEKAFLRNNTTQIRDIIDTLLSDLPYDLFSKDLPTSERFYHSLIHLIFKYLGIFIESEVHARKARADCVVQTPTHIYIFEFKHDQSAQIALQQIKDKQYADKFRTHAKIVVGIGVNYVFDSRTIEGWLEETL